MSGIMLFMYNHWTVGDESSKANHNLNLQEHNLTNKKTASNIQAAKQIQEQQIQERPQIQEQQPYPDAPQDMHSVVHSCLACAVHQLGPMLAHKVAPLFPLQLLHAQCISISINHEQLRCN